MAKRGKTVRKPVATRKAPPTRKRAPAGLDAKNQNSRLRRELADALERGEGDPTAAGRNR
jgi:hypothetical protein